MNGAKSINKVDNKSGPLFNGWIPFTKGHNTEKKNQRNDR